MVSDQGSGIINSVPLSRWGWVSGAGGVAAGEVERVLFDGYLYCRQMRELTAKMADFILRLDSET